MFRLTAEQAEAITLLPYMNKKMNVILDILLDLRRREMYMANDIATLNQLVQDVTDEEHTLESAVTTALNDLVAKQSQPSPDLSTAINLLTNVKTAMTNLAQTAQTDDPGVVTP